MPVSWRTVRAFGRVYVGSSTLTIEDNLELVLDTDDIGALGGLKSVVVWPINLF